MDNSQGEESEAITYKIILIGDSSVGKTCLFKKLTTGKYSEKNISTIGIDRKSFPLKVKVEENGQEVEKNFLIQLWDTAGQERFRSITKGYYKDSQGLLLMYDITNRETFDDLDKWITGVKESLGEEENAKENKYIIILMGNKVDLASDGGRKVETSDAEKLCQDNDIIWGGECSAKDSTIEELNEKFQEYTKELFKKIGYSISRSTIAAKSNSNKKEKAKGKCC
jgi:small GTP-binding protein